jgi:hypothetical protein
MDLKAAKRRIFALEEAIENVLVGGNHVALLLGVDHPPYTWEPANARLMYLGRQEAYEAWCCWRSIMQARDVLNENEGE